MSNASWICIIEILWPAPNRRIHLRRIPEGGLLAITPCCQAPVKNQPTEQSTVTPRKHPPCPCNQPNTTDVPEIRFRSPQRQTVSVVRLHRLPRMRRIFGSSLGHKITRG